MRRILLPLVLSVLTFAVLSGTAAAAQQGSANCPLVLHNTQPHVIDGALPGMPVTRQDAVRIVQRSAAVQRDVSSSRANGRLVFAATAKCWQVNYFKRGALDNTLVNVIVDAQTGQVAQLWSGLQASEPIARHLGFNSIGPFYKLWAWLPLTLCFLLFFFDWKKLLRVSNLDTLVLGGGFVLSFDLFVRTAATELSVFVTGAALAYLGARFICMALGYARPPTFTSCLSTRWAAVALLLLIGLRLGVTLLTAAPYDVGEASLIGAQLIEHGQHLYGNPTWTHGLVYGGDTYGPAMYLSYLPAQLVWPAGNSATSITLTGVYFMAIAFDFLALAGLAVLGWRWGGNQRRRMAVLLPLAWAACPFTFYQLLDSFHDSLIAALVIWSLVFLGKPIWRGVLVAAAAMSNFLPLVIAPLIVKGTGTTRQAWRAVAACVIVAVLLAIPMFHDGLITAYHSIVTYQSGRTEKMTIWGYFPGIVSDVLRALLALTLATVGLGVVARRPCFTRWQVAALAAGLLCAIELLLPYWWFNYLPWFLGAAFPALLLAQTANGPEAAPSVKEPKLSSSPEQRLLLLGGLLAAYLVWRLVSSAQTMGDTMLPQVLALTVIWLAGAVYTWRTRPQITAWTGRAACALLLLSAGTALGVALTYAGQGHVTGSVFSMATTVVFHVNDGGNPDAIYLIIAAISSGLFGLSLALRGRDASSSAGETASE